MCFFYAREIASVVGAAFLYYSLQIRWDWIAVYMGLYGICITSIYLLVIEVQDVLFVKERGGGGGG